MQNLNRGLFRFADLAEERGGVRDGAGDDLFQGVPGPLGERRTEIGDEPVQIEYGRLAPSMPGRVQTAPPQGDATARGSD